MAERARDRAEVIRGEALRDVGVIERLLADRPQYLVGQRGDLEVGAGAARLVRLAVGVIGDLGAIGIGVGDALVIFARDTFGDGGIDAVLGARRYHAVTLRQAGVERLGARIADHHHVLVALHAGGDRPLDPARGAHTSIVVGHDDSP